MHANFENFRMSTWEAKAKVATSCLINKMHITNFFHGKANSVDNKQMMKMIEQVTHIHPNTCTSQHY